jgi:hypothetical protein
MDEKRITLRLPSDVHDEITRLAEQDVRSLNAEILVLLREAIAARQRQRRRILDAEEESEDRYSPALAYA